MAIIGTFNGADIVAWPARPGIKEIELVGIDAASLSSSPYTGSQQVQWWPGGDQWSASITLPQMTAADVGPWNAFLLQLRGIKNVFQIGHPQRRVPRGITKGLPLVDGANVAMSTTLATKGWVPSVRGQLMPFDHIQVGYYLHAVLDQVDSDANGNATINIWPGLRGPIADGTAITLKCPKGIFRLAENSRSVTTNETQLSALKVIKCMEAK